MTVRKVLSNGSNISFKTDSPTFQRDGKVLIDSFNLRLICAFEKNELKNLVELQASNGATQSSGACGGQVEEDDEESSSSSLTASSAVEVRISILSWYLSALMNIVMNHD